MSEHAPRVPVPRRGEGTRHRIAVAGLTTWAVIAIATVSVAAGGAVAAVAAAVSGSGSAANAAALGALGAIAAALVAAAGTVVVRHSSAGRSIELLRAASPTHPLLKRLMTEAPGTYVHSLTAANLSEAAAEVVGADPLVARVGAYYHDIGKLAQPCYFFENQQEGVNPHEGADPADSAGLIMSHVADGYDLGRSYDLPTPVLGIIRQHHGTSVVRYFYHQAAQADASAYEADFRYHGETPTSVEAAIVMLADASEASVRAMSHPDVAGITERVESVIDERRRDGQLRAAGLSDDDLLAIRDVFVKQLVSFRHLRCQYPNASLPAEGEPDADKRPEPSRV